MKHYDRIIMNRLLDSYENSSLYKGSNRVKVSIALHVTKKNFPEYFSENSGDYEEIHIAAEMLERAGLAEAVWKGGHKGHILDKVVLNMKQIRAAYEYVGRKDKRTLTDNAVSMIESMPVRGAEVTAAFARYLVGRLREGGSIREFGDVNEPGKLMDLLKTVRAIEMFTGEIYLREFSVSVSGDSKAVERIKGTIAKVFRRFSDGRFQEETFEEILAEYGIYSTPNYVYFKGCGVFGIAGGLIDLGKMCQGIGLSGEDLEHLRVSDLSMVRKVVTIENLTSFFSFSEPGCMAIYLGGYHNRIRRRMLSIIYEALPEVTYLHFGDIDAGGFEIFFDLRRKTGIDFRPYKMDAETLKFHGEFGKPLTAADIRHLETLHKKLTCGEKGYRIEDEETEKTATTEILHCIEEMLERNIKLEQECIGIQRETG